MSKNNASETSGEAEIVERLMAAQDDWPASLIALELEAAETIERLIAERDAAISCSRDLASNIRPLIDRAEAAEKERDRFKFNADELRKSRKRQAQRYHRLASELIKRTKAAEKIASAMQRLDDAQREDLERSVKRIAELEDGLKLASLERSSLEYRLEDEVRDRERWENAYAELEAQLKFTDQQSEKLEELLEPQIEWEKIT